MKKNAESKRGRSHWAKKIAAVAVSACLMMSAIPMTASAASYITQKKAVKIATTNASVNTSSSKYSLTEADFDKDDGVAVWEIEFKYGKTKYEYEIKATNGKIIKKDVEIGKAAAKKAALKKAGIKSSAVKKWTVTHKDKAGYYSVKMTTKSYVYTMRVNEATGKVTKYKKAKAASSSSTYIGKSKAKSKAIADAKKTYGMTATARNVDVELDTKKGVKVYEVEFDAGKYEYEYVVNAKTGKIIDRDRERD